jgi:hypothetical protein
MAVQESFYIQDINTSSSLKTDGTWERTNDDFNEFRSFPTKAEALVYIDNISDGAYVVYSRIVKTIYIMYL